MIYEYIELIGFLTSSLTNANVSVIVIPFSKGSSGDNLYPIINSGLLYFSLILQHASTTSNGNLILFSNEPPHSSFLIL